MQNQETFVKCEREKNSERFFPVSQKNKFFCSSYSQKSKVFFLVLRCKNFVIKMTTFDPEPKILAIFAHKNTKWKINITQYIGVKNAIFRVIFFWSSVQESSRRIL